MQHDKGAGWVSPHKDVPLPQLLPLWRKKLKKEKITVKINFIQT